MVILGVDPGYDRLGFSVFNIANHPEKIIDYGFITSDKDKKFEKRLVEIADDLKEIVNRYNVEEAGIEEIYIQKNIKTVIGVSHARGVVIELLTRLGVDVYHYTPQEIKISLTGAGNASKEDVQKAVNARRLFNQNIKQDDTADAIAIALCHIQSRKIKKIYE